VIEPAAVSTLEGPIPDRNLQPCSIYPFAALAAGDARWAVVGKVI
jgi:hypothetical protein